MTLKTRFFLAGAVLAAACTAGAQTFQDLVKADPNNWMTYSGSYDGQRHTQLKQVNTGNVQNLAPKWVFHIAGSVKLEAVPLVMNGVMYVAQLNHVDALDAASGRMIWQYQRQPVSRGAHRGIAIADNKIFVGTADSAVVALDARNGSVLWETKMPGQGIRYQGGAPLVVKNKVMVGGNSPEGGFIDGYDTESGKHLWRWNVLPKPGEPGSETWEGDGLKVGGGPMWHTGTYDPQLNLAFFGTGQPGMDFVGDYRKGDNLYTDCMVALDPDTGKMKWYFQFTPHDVHDYDAVEIPVLVDAAYKGQPRKLLLQANRNGYYYILDRTNGKFLQGTPFVKVITWASGLTEDGRPVKVPGSEPSVQGTRVCPPTAGATNWPSPAYNPDTKLFYVVVQEGCGINIRGASKFELRPGVPTGSGTGYMESAATQDRWQLYLRAIDSLTGKIAWDYKQIGSNHYGPGALSTAGGLVFTGEQQGNFTALDAKTGKALWHFNTGDFITASPMAYGAGGVQYLAIVAGTNVFAFALPGGRP